MGSKKAMAIFLAAVMVAVAIGSVLQITDDTSATEGTQAQGNVNVYFKGPGQSSASVASVDAYDLYEAVVKAGTTLGYTVQTATGNDSWKTLVPSSPSSYYDINKDYGVISAITTGSGTSSSTLGVSNYSIYVYNKVSGSTTFSWNPAIDAIGWYHPYSDYSATGSISNTTYSLASANIAIIHGNEQPAVTEMKNLTSVERYDSTYQFTFVLQGNVPAVSLNIITEGANGFETMAVTEEEIAGGIFMYGWGSNAYEALKDAIGSSNITGQNQNAILNVKPTYEYYTYYSWVGQILGLENTSAPPYHYWSTSYYDDNGNEAYCDFTLGYYTTVTGNAFEHVDTFNVIYQ